MPEILFSDVEPEAIEAAVISAYEHISGATLYPGDPVRLFLESLAYTLVVQNGVINLAGRQNLLAYASGSHLDYIGMMVGTDRLADTRARARQAFWLAKPLDFPVSIPSGTRVGTADGRAMFILVENLDIKAGELMTSGIVEAARPGAIYNGLIPGQISMLIDPVAYIVRTENQETSLLGSDVETDERYRSRIREAPEHFSCAGPVGAYRYHAMAAHPDIAEVAIWTPVPGTVDVRPVLKGGELPPPDILEKVRGVLNADNVRPLTDTVLVAAPELVEYDISLVWYLAREKQALLSTITERVAAAVEEYRIWQRTMPGRDITPLRLASLVEQAGARRIELQSPGYEKLQGWQLAREREVKVVFGGVEEI